jgi:Tfp pilus assembly protein PilN
VRLLAVGETTGAVDDALGAIDGVEILRDETPAVERAARSAHRLLAGRSVGWVELRRDGLAPADLHRRLRPWLSAAAMLGLSLALVAAGGLYWRSRQLAQAAEAVERQQEIVYRELYATGPLPVDVASRLRSEVRRLAGVRGMGVEVPQRVCALEALRRMTSELPPGLRVRITSVQIHAGAVYIEGQARSHSDAETVAQALKRAGLEMERPRTERLATDGVAFTLSGEVSATGPEARVAADDRTAEDRP